MKNLWNYIKDKSYYFLGGTVIIIILLIIITSCSGGNGNDYEAIEEKMVSAAKKYYENKKDHLPKEEGNSVKVTISSLVESELMKEVTDPKDSSNECSGYVEVTKVDDEYSYVPFLTCKGNYEPEYLVDKIKKVKTDELGNGVYTIGNEYVYRGSDVNNYVSFNDLTWRIIKVDENNDIKLVLIICDILYKIIFRIFNPILAFNYICYCELKLFLKVYFRVVTIFWRTLVENKFFELPITFHQYKYFKCIFLICKQRGNNLMHTILEISSFFSIYHRHILHHL